MKISTDREILDRLFNMYASDFEAAQQAPDKDGNRIYVPIDIPAVAEQLGDNEHVLFGRLFYHLDQKHRYQQAGGAMVHLFSAQVGNARHCINYPLLCAVLADLREQHTENTKAFWLSLAALALSLGAIVAQIAS